MISSRTPEGLPDRCPFCGHRLRIEPSLDTLDAPCPRCGSLLWFGDALQISAVKPSLQWLAHMPPQNPAERRPGVVFQERFEIRKRLGRGPLGWVFGAFDTGLERGVALKIVPCPRNPAKGLWLNFFSTMARTGSLGLPNVRRVFHVDGDREFCFAVSALQPVSLSTERGRFRRDRHATALLGAKLARALESIHAQELFHGNLKPNNVLFDAAGEPLLADFGPYEAIGPDGGKPLAATFRGPPSYAAPEQVRDRLTEIGPASDLWSLGAILYELVDGSRPFGGQSHDEICTGIKTRDPAPLDPSVEPSLRAVITNCLQKNRKMRYTSAAALANDLEIAALAIPPGDTRA